MRWNFKEELVTSGRTSSSTVIPEQTYYQYDSKGKRLRKVTENQAALNSTPTLKNSRTYIEGYEFYKDYGSNEITHSLSLIDGGQRFVMVEDSNTYGYLVRYQHPNHQSSCTLETDDIGRVINYEEYHPFGTTSYQATNASITASYKRYRYTGMERDEETGLSYHNARYYISWLGRWLSPDPIGIGDGVNVYSYCQNNTVGNNDKTGTQSNLDPTQLLRAAGTGNNTINTNALISQAQAEAEVKQAADERTAAFEKRQQDSIEINTTKVGQRPREAFIHDKYKDALESRNPFESNGAQRAMYHEINGEDTWYDIYSYSHDANNFYMPKGEGIKPQELEVKPGDILLRPKAQTEQVYKPSNQKAVSFLKTPQGLTKTQFSEVSKLLMEKLGMIGKDIVIQGSRASGTAKPTSDMDIAILVPEAKFNQLLNQFFGKPNAGSAKERTMLHAEKTGKIQSGEAKLSQLRESLEKMLGMKIDISIIKSDGKFDNGAQMPLYIPERLMD